MFPMNKIKTIGIYYGVEDNEKIDEIVLNEKDLKQKELNIKGFDGFMSWVYPQTEKDFLTVQRRSNIEVWDIANSIQVLSYKPRMPRYGLSTEYSYGKCFSGNPMKLMSVFKPFIDDSNGIILSQSIVIDDLQENKTIKRLQVRNNRPPFISFFSNATIYRDGMVNTTFLKWKAVDDSLEPIEHPLVPVLNDFNDTFRIEQFQASETQECALVSGYTVIMDEKVGPTKFMVIPWKQNSPAIPIFLPENLLPSQYLSEKNFLLSPSGKWLFFTAAENRGDDRYFLTYIDKNLPTYYAPPIEIDTDGDDFEVTWMKEPEGFVLHTGKILRYWDLSKFDPTAFNKSLK